MGKRTDHDAASNTESKSVTVTHADPFTVAYAHSNPYAVAIANSITNYDDGDFERGREADYRAPQRLADRDRPADS